MLKLQEVYGCIKMTFFMCLVEYCFIGQIVATIPSLMMHALIVAINDKIYFPTCQLGIHSLHRTNVPLLGDPLGTVSFQGGNRMLPSSIIKMTKNHHIGQ